MEGESFSMGRDLEESQEPMMGDEPYTCGMRSLFIFKFSSIRSDTYSWLPPSDCLSPPWELSEFLDELVPIEEREESKRIVERNRDWVLSERDDDEEMVGRGWLNKGRWRWRWRMVAGSTLSITWTLVSLDASLVFLFILSLFSSVMKWELCCLCIGFCCGVLTVMMQREPKQLDKLTSWQVELVGPKAFHSSFDDD